MKKLLFLITGLLLFFSVEGQISRYPFYTAPATSSGSDTTGLNALLTDGETFGFFIADADYLDLTSSSIDQWDDLSGDNNHLLQSTADNKPTWDSANGEVDFDGADDEILDGSISAHAQPLTCYYVIRVNSFTSNGPILTLASTQYLRFSSGNAETKLKLYGTDATIIQTGESFYSLSTYYIIRTVFNGTETSGSKIQINEATAYVGTLASNSTEFIRLGGSSTYSGFSLKEMILRSSLDSDEEQMLVVNYLNDKYSIY
jgi:hypothetical protein